MTGGENGVNLSMPVMPSGYGMGNDMFGGNGAW